MITVNNFSIINNGQQLAIDVETNVGSNITSILLWDMNSFKDYSLAINISDQLEQVNESEVLIISAVDIGVLKFEDIWFMEVQSNYEDPDPDCSTCELPALAITYNLLPYYQCMLDYLIQSGLNDCESCNNTIQNNMAITISLLLDAVEKALELGFYLQAIEMVKQTKKYCNIKKCNNCKSVECSNCSKFKQFN